MKESAPVTRPSTIALSLLAALAADAARAQAPAAAELQTGDTVEFDLSQLPRRYEGVGKAVCKGTVVGAIGPEERACERTYRFEVPPGDVRMTYLFRAASGGTERRVDVPLTRENRKVTFRAPADGTLAPAAPVEIPGEVTERAAQAAARSECGKCQGGAFVLEAFEVTQPPEPVDGSGSIRLEIDRTTR